MKRASPPSVECDHRENNRDRLARRQTSGEHAQIHGLVFSVLIITTAEADESI